jgi:arylformamidase
MKHFSLIIALLTAITVSFGQTTFNWQKNLDLPFTDVNGIALTGTEVIHIVTHKNKLFAGNSYWNETTAPRRGQIWVKETATDNWKRDYQMPASNSRVPSLYSFTFSKDKNGATITPDTLLFAGATRDYGNGSGPAVVFVRNDANNTWLQHDFQTTSHPFGYTQIRSMGFHRDKVTGADIVFAGANPTPTGTYAGRYNATTAGKIDWDATPEFTPAGYQRIMGFAVCQDTLYMATQREIYKRIDGVNPRWVQVYNLATPAIISQYGSNLDTYWLNDEDIRGFRAIKNPNGAGQVMIFGALNHIFRVEPQNNYRLVAEQNIQDVLETATGHDFHYLQTQIIKDYKVPNTNDTVQLIGFEAFYDTTYLARNPQPNFRGFNKQGWYFERRQSGGTISYELKEIIDYRIAAQPDSLARVRTFEVSPFKQDSGKVVYSGGFAPWFIGGVTNTAWIYKGTLQANPVAGYTKTADINYKTGTPQNLLNLDVYKPNGGAAKKPVMIYVHGGSWRTGDKAQTGFKDEFFTNKDYVFVSVNYRLSPNPINLNDPNRLQFPAHPQDVAKAIKWVFQNIANYGGDTNRVSVIGHSSGAHLVSLVTTDATYLNAEGLQLNQLKCACSLDAGAYDINYYMNTYESPNSGQWNTYVNAFGSNTTTWQNASPINHLAPNKGIAPFMLVYQGNAQRIDLATRFGNALTRNNIPKTLLNASPLDHEGINGVLGSAIPQAQIYNDSVANFFTNCLRNRTTAVSETKNWNTQFALYPNPTNGEIVLQLDDYKASDTIFVDILSLDGKVLHHAQLTNDTAIFDLSAYANGLYLMKISGNSGVLVKKIVKN